MPQIGRAISGQSAGKDQPHRSEPLISISDIVVTAGLVPMMLTAWLAPRAVRERLAWGMARAMKAIKQSRTTKEAARLAAPFGITDTDAFYLDVLAQGQLERLSLFALHGPFADEPVTHVEGAHHVHAALAAGRGVLLWVTATSHSRSETKLSLFRENIRAHHLSRDTHGFSPTRYGKAVLNPLRTLVEARYLASRVVFGDEGASRALAQLSKLLAAGRIVSITMGDQANRTIAVPFLSGRLRIATRPIALARETDADLLPVASVRMPDGSITTRIGACLMARGSQSQNDDEAVVRDLADFLAPLASAHPDQFARANIFHPKGSGNG